MKVTLLTAGSRGDVEPYLALAVGLRRAGHDVCLATHRGFAGWVVEHGVGFAPVAHVPPSTGGSNLWERWQRSGENVAGYVYYMLRIARRARALLAAMQADFWAASRDAEAIVSSTSGFGGPQIAAARGIPHTWALFQPMSPTRAFPHFMTPFGRSLGPTFNRATYRVAELIFWLLFRPALDDWSRRNSVGRQPRRPPPVTFLGIRPPLVLYGYSGHVVPRPEDWGERIHLCGYWSLPPVSGWQPDPALLDFLDLGPPPVYFYLTGIRYPDWAGLLRLVLTALQRTGQRALVYLGMEDEDVVSWPATALPVRGVPHDWLFPQVAAVVHHGGAGVTASALRAGVPSVTVPGYWDQPFWGRRLRALGAAPSPIPVRKLTADRLTAALTAVLETPGYRRSAAAVGRRLQGEDGVAAGVAHLEAYWDRFSTGRLA